MTQKDKDLLLKDLCARLPYKVKFKYEDRPEVCGILSITPIYENGNVVYFDRYVNEPKKCSIYDVKPYLFPMTSMTEEQRNEYHELANGMFGTGVLINFEFLEDFFHKNHLDYRGLIPMGLAIDATNLNIY